ncbi:MAG: VRR-NUC domain-containing protein [Burkholderiaceae bacterium]|nr:VRR-NUC domain-containing protein [Burkholderiaceae bacterium]
MYYLHNFQFVLDWVAERYGDLLNDDEHKFIVDFRCTPMAAQALLVRLVMRRAHFFRLSKLRYAEIGDITTALAPLIELNWVKLDPELSVQKLFDVLLKSEVGQVFSLSTKEAALRKADQLVLLSERESEIKPFSCWAPSVGDQLIQLTVKTLCDRLRLIFFGNSYQDWSEFVLTELGIYDYEVIPFTPASRGFQSRQDIDDYLALDACRTLFDEGVEIDQLIAQLLDIQSNNPWIARRRASLVFQIGQALEKAKEWSAALSVYALDNALGTRVRMIRVLEKNGQHAAALQLLQQALNKPESEAEIQQLRRGEARLMRKAGAAKDDAPPRKKANTEVASTQLCLPSPNATLSVEQIVQVHLHSDDAPVFYVENTLINSLFGLLCWSAIFKPLPGAFFHPFHRGPVDLSSADFHQRREADFAACFALLDNGDYGAAIRQTFREKVGKQSPFVAWGVIDEAIIDLALQCIPSTHLRRLFERILADIKVNRNGFPDLIQFWPREHRYCMIEVKAPGDKLQDNQLRFLDFCAQHQLPVRVCYVTWEGQDKRQNEHEIHNIEQVDAR